MAATLLTWLFRSFPLFSALLLATGIPLHVLFLSLVLVLSLSLSPRWLAAIVTFLGANRRTCCPFFLPIRRQCRVDLNGQALCRVRRRCRRKTYFSLRPALDPIIEKILAFQIAFFSYEVRYFLFLLFSNARESDPPPHVEFRPTRIRSLKVYGRRCEKHRRGEEEGAAVSSSSSPISPLRSLPPS